MRNTSRIRPAAAWTLGLALLGAAALASPAGAQVTYGTLDNFDVINDTGGPCHGFEIELDGILPTDVAYTFGGTYQRYGDPVVIATPTGVSIQYSATYAAGNWSATTPFTAPPWLPTQGHSCWTGGVADPAEYFAGGCDHFGASLNAAPTATRYHWLVEGPLPGSLVRYGSQVTLPTPTWNVTSSPAGNPVAAAAITPPPPGAYEFGDALWAKVFVTELPDGLHPDDLDHLVVDDPLVDIVPDEPIEVEVEWVLLQAGGGADGEQEFGAGVEVGAGNDAVSRRFEFYAYAGAYDVDTHEALCDNPLAPDQQIPERCGLPVDGVAGVGDLIGTHNAAVNLAGPVPPSNNPPVAVNDVTSVSEDGAIVIDVLVNDSDPDADTLTLDSVYDVYNGVAVIGGNGVTFTPAANYNGPASFMYAISDGHGGTATGFVDMTVLSVNDAPACGADAAATDEDVALLIGFPILLGNDVDVDGDVLTVSSVQDAIGGTAALRPDGVVFTPAPNFFGAASFVYVVDDGHGGSATAPVSVTVGAVNDAPVAVAAGGPTVRRRATVRLDGTGSWDVEADPLAYTWAFVSVPPRSRATLSDPHAARPTFVADKTGAYVVALTVNDGQLTSAVATVTVTATNK